MSSERPMAGPPKFQVSGETPGSKPPDFREPFALADKERERADESAPEARPPKFQRRGETPGSKPSDFHEPFAPVDKERKQVNEPFALVDKERERAMEDAEIDKQRAQALEERTETSRSEELNEIPRIKETLDAVDPAVAEQLEQYRLYYIPQSEAALAKAEAEFKKVAGMSADDYYEQKTGSAFSALKFGFKRRFNREFRTALANYESASVFFAATKEAVAKLKMSPEESAKRAGARAMSALRNNSVSSPDKYRGLNT